jgi:DNA-binding MarR family transcriptional regulator
MPTSTRTAELGSALRVSVMRLARRLRHERPADMPPLTHLATLGTLDRHGPMTPGELAAHERVQPPSMTRILAVLGEQGLITRAPHPTDRRQVLVALTDDARALLREDRRRRDQWLSRQLAQLTPADRAVLADAAVLLDRLARS